MVTNLAFIQYRGGCDMHGWDRVLGIEVIRRYLPGDAWCLPGDAWCLPGDAWCLSGDASCLRRLVGTNG